MLDFMSARRFYLVVAVVAVVGIATFVAFNTSSDADAEAERLRTVETSRPLVTSAQTVVSDSVEPDQLGSPQRAINLALVIDGDSSKFRAIPENPEEVLRELAAAADAGAPDAADSLFLFAMRCGPDATIPVPSTEAAYAEARERLIQTRTLTTPGPIVSNLDRALGFMEAGYRLCSAFERLGLPGAAHWNRVAAKLGSHYAMAFFWEIQRGTEDWEAVQARGIEYLERARDDGYVPAFLHIGMSYADLVPDGPYSADRTDGLAHLYALRELRTAIRAERNGSGVYEETPLQRRADESIAAMNARYVEQLEMQVSPFQMQVARERAEELLDRCCR